MEQKRTSIILAGAAPDSGNHGVTALARSAIAGLMARGPFDITCLDNTAGFRKDPDFAPPYTIQRAGFRPGRNVLRRENIWQVRLSQGLGLPHPLVKLMKNSSAVLDVSGGDSFSDIYGNARFRQIVAAKKMALDMGIPLILLPQTIGPFKSEAAQKTARNILKRAALVYARDRQSYDRLISLLGTSFDPQRHRLGVDLAFGLEPRHMRDHNFAGHVGINVSGLLWNKPEYGQQQFGLSVDYRQLILSLIENLSARGFPVVLVPHVIAPNSEECDLAASRAVQQTMPDHIRSRVKIYDGPYCPSALKGVIRQTEWFTGARMHATIAALSSATPVVNMAYSDKAAGVFEGMASGSEVIDLRSASTSRALAHCLNAFECRNEQRKALRAALPNVKQQWQAQMNAIAEYATAQSQPALLLLAQGQAA